MDIDSDSQFALLLDPEIFDYFRTSLDASFRDGMFHESVSSTISTAAIKIVNNLIGELEPLFNRKHIQKVYD